MIANQMRAAAPGAATYDGYCYRDNLASVGDVPADSPYGQCPDIIRSSEPIADPQAELTSAESLGTLYDCAPTPGTSDYYYLRALNGTSSSASTELSLYAAPAQLILDPGSWTTLITGSGGSSVSASCPPGDYAVGCEPFVWNAPPAAGDGFYTFIAQAGRGAPSISDWNDLAELLTQELDLGIHNVEAVAPGQSWERALGLSIPASFPPVTLTLTVTANGFDGCRLGIIASRFTDAGKPVMLNPVQLSDSFMTGFQFPGDPGYDANLYVQCWAGTAPPAAGSTITLELTCVVSEEMIEEAAARNLLDSGLANRVARALGGQVNPQQVIPVGAATFIVNASTG